MTREKDERIVGEKIEDCVSGPVDVQAATLRIHDPLLAAADARPDSPAVTDATGRWSYRDLAMAARAAAGRLRDLGVGAGNRVVARCAASRQFVALMYGCSMVGATFVPVHVTTREFHLSAIVEDASAALVVSDCGDGTDAAIGDLVPTEPGAESFFQELLPAGPALLLYTSGTTSPLPKAVISRHRSVLFVTDAIGSRLDYRASDVVLCRLPLSFDYGLYQVFLSVAAGAELVLCGPESDAQLVALARRTGATILPLLPTLAGMILDLLGRDTEPLNVRLITNTGEELRPRTLAALRQRIPTAAIQLMFGLTECKRVSIMEPDGDLVRPGSVGRALPGTRVEIVDGDGIPVGPDVDGEIVVHGEHVMDGYWRSPEATARAFRADSCTGRVALHTGDYGWLDADGYLYYSGRRDSLFKRRGMRMSLGEIEAAALDVPGVTEAVAVPPANGDDLVLVAVTSLAPAQLLQEVRRRLPPEKTPSSCRTVSVLPRSANGKVDRAAAARLSGRGVSTAATIASEYCTPAYIYDLADLDRAADSLRSCLPEPSGLYYSLKANPHPAVAARLRRRGCGAEISSEGELDAALTAGFRPDQILYTGPAKTRPEIAAAVRRGVDLFSVESAADFHRVCATAAEAGRPVRCLVRIDNGAVAAGGLRMSGGATPFGIAADLLLARRDAFADRPGGRIVGLHFFSGSSVEDEDGLVRQLTAAVDTAVRLRLTGFTVDVLDLGGGFAAPYGRPGTLPVYQGLRKRAETVLDEELPGWRTGDPEVVFESGRYLAGTCGRLVTTVMDAKTSGGREFVLLDAGINHLAGLAGLGRLVLLDGIRPEHAAEPDGDVRQVTLAGPLCTPADVLARQVPVGELGPGDVLVIPNVGAYGPTASLLAFLGRRPPAEIVVDGGRVVSATRLRITRVPIAEEGDAS